jgi:hypothetical protein
MGNFRSTINQGPEVTRGAGKSEILQEVATRIHDGDDDPRQILPKHQRPGHRYKGYGINSHPARQEVADHGAKQSHDHGDCPGGPAPVGPIVSANTPGGKTEQEAGQRNCGQRPAQHPVVHDHCSF